MNMYYKNVDLSIFMDLDVARNVFDLLRGGNFIIY